MRKTFLFFAFLVALVVLGGVSLNVKGALYPDIPEPEPIELQGYRPLVDSDVGKMFGIELANKIYFNLDYEIGWNILQGMPPYTSAGVLIEWVVPGNDYLLKLWSGGIVQESADIYSVDVFFGQGLNMEDNKRLLYQLDFNDATGSYVKGYHITNYDVPSQSFINEIYYNAPKDFILVKDLSYISYWEDIYDKGYGAGFKDGKEAYGGFLNGQWYTAEDYGAWQYNRGMSEQLNVFEILIGGIFGALTAFGNLEILPGLKIFYVVGIFVVFGVVGFIIQKKFGGDD